MTPGPALLSGRNICTRRLQKALDSPTSEALWKLMKQETEPLDYKLHLLAMRFNVQHVLGCAQGGSRCTTWSILCTRRNRWDRPMLNALKWQQCLLSRSSHGCEFLTTSASQKIFAFN